MTDPTDERLRVALAGLPEEPTALAATGVRSLAGIESYARLTSVVLEGCALSDLSPLAQLPQLERLAVRYSVVPDPSGLRACSKLRHLELFLCSTQDISSLAPIASLQTVDVVGCPCSDDSIEQVRARVARLWVSMPPYLEVARQLSAAGTGLTYGRRYGCAFVLRPGPSQRTGATCDFVADVPLSAMPALLEAAAAGGDLLQTLGGASGNHPTESTFVEEGFSAEALAWLSPSAVGDSPVFEALRRLVRHFPLLRWGHLTESTLAEVRASLEVALPDWYAATLTSLSEIEPGAINWVRFPRRSGARPSLFSLSVIFEAWRSHGTALRQFKLLPVALERVLEPTLLAVRANGSETDPVLIVPPDERPVDSESLLEQAFPSYAALLDAIDQVTLEDGSVFQRQGKT